MGQSFSEFVTIGDIADVRGGKRLPKGMVVKDEETRHPYLRVVDFNNEGIDRSNIKYIDENAFAKVKRYTISIDDVYISIAGTIGRVGIIPKDLSGANLTENAAKITNIKSNFHKMFLMYYLRSHIGQSDISSKIVGTSQPKLALFRIQELKVPKAPLPTQHKIASILSAYDELIENNTRRIKILEEMAQSIYREWFVNYRFPGHEKVKMVDSPLGMIPEGWEVKKLGEIVIEIRDSVNPKSLESTTPYLGLEHLPRKSLFLNDYGNASQVDSTKLFFSEGDILFGKIRPYFHKVVISHIQGICSTDILVIRPILDLFHSLVSLTVFSEDFVNFSSQTSQGTKMPRANWNVLSKYPVLNPSEDLLIEFSKITDDLFKLSRTLILANFQFRQTRDFLLPRLISGEVDVTDLDIQIPEELTQ